MKNNKKIVLIVDCLDGNFSTKLKWCGGNFIYSKQELIGVVTDFKALLIKGVHESLQDDVVYWISYPYKALGNTVDSFYNRFVDKNEVNYTCIRNELLLDFCERAICSLSYIAGKKFKFKDESLGTIRVEFEFTLNGMPFKPATDVDMNKRWKKCIDDLHGSSAKPS